MIHMLQGVHGQIILCTKLTKEGVLHIREQTFKKIPGYVGLSYSDL